MSFISPENLAPAGVVRKLGATRGADVTLMGIPNLECWHHPASSPTA